MLCAKSPDACTEVDSFSGAHATGDGRQVAPADALFELSRGRDGIAYRDRGGRVCIVAQEGREAALRRCAELHRDVPPNLMYTVEQGPGWAKFGPEIGTGLTAIVDRIAGNLMSRMCYPSAIALLQHLVNTIGNAHASGKYLGSFGLANVFFTQTGDPVLLGLGGLMLSAQDHVSPRVSLGSPPNERCDTYAVEAALRTMLPMITLPEPLLRAYTGRAKREDKKVAACVKEHELFLMQGRGKYHAANAASLLALHEETWSSLDVFPDHGALRDLARGVHQELGYKHARVVYENYRPRMRLADGRIVDLHRRPVLARLLDTLVRAHADRGCEGLGPEQLIEHVWPGETIQYNAARNRLHVALSKLRSEGLGDLLGRDSAGRYSLDRQVLIEHHLST